jgi:hypothetical protein
MREATNLGWTDTPFGAARRPFADRTPLLVAFSIYATATSPAAAAVYLRLPRGRTLQVSDTSLRFGFHGIAAEGPDEDAAVTTLIDALLVQARRQAAIVAGHCFTDELASLTASGGGQATRGISAVSREWKDGGPGRGLARLHDTANEPVSTSLADVGARLHLPGLPAAFPPPEEIALAAPGLLRHLVVRALAIALIAARHAGHYQWQRLHLDDVVEAAAWDQLVDRSAGAAHNRSPADSDQPSPWPRPLSTGGADQTPAAEGR